jgi:hypothetical protein
MQFVVIGGLIELPFLKNVKSLISIVFPVFYTGTTIFHSPPLSILNSFDSGW